MNETTSKTSHRTTLAWTGIVVLAAVFLAAGTTKLAGLEMHTMQFSSWGYPIAFMYVVGIAEVVGALALLAPPTERLGQAILSVVMIGAIITHLWHAEWLMAMVPIVLVTLLIAVGQKSTRIREPHGVRPSADAARSGPEHSRHPHTPSPGAAGR